MIAMILVVSYEVLLIEQYQALCHHNCNVFSMDWYNKRLHKYNILSHDYI